MSEVVSTVPQGKITDITTVAKSTVKERNATVTQRVIDAIVEQELATRVTLVQKAYSMYSVIEKKLKNIRPKPFGFNEDNTPVQVVYSEQQIKERKSCTEALAAFDNAFTTAMSAEANYEPLAKAVEKYSNLATNNKTPDAAPSVE